MSWQNPDSGNSGSVVPQPVTQLAYGTYCREFTQVITVGGQSEQVYGRACRQRDGTWRVM